ncbi:cytochrome c oxidase cbb3-type subunit II [Myxococcaceae bacterium]|nr:cytochrome c oxidase cbb3-type subunit II [Myxococcaceae bacterium]
MAHEWHRRLEARQLTFAVLAFVAVAIGGLVLLIPPYFLQGTITPLPGVKPYTALELEGRDIYVREGCYTCHSQQIRPFKTEVDRYGPYSLAGESVYDRPFQFGSRRTGPDLARVGGKYPDSWHWIHLRDPREIEPRSNMPRFDFLLEAPLDLSHTRKKLEVMRRLGTPYDDAEIEGAVASAQAQLAKLADGLRAGGMEISEIGGRSEGLAVIAYLQKLGTGIDWRSRGATEGRTADAR